ncbi:MAG TPA: preprotein translocase subunit SecG [Phycisphaerales bacterium]|nr:preprotein translocase subunit SecG [Phycisphaerales bacterium]
MVLTTGSVLVTLLSIAFVFVCVLLVLLILIQRPKGGGLAGAFGGAGGGSDQAMFGAKAGDALTWITVGLFVCFLGLAMGLTWTTRPGDEVSDVPVMTLPIDGEETDAATTTDEAADAAGDKVDAAVQTVKDAADTTTEAVKEGTAKAVQVTGEAVDKAVEVTKDAVEAVKTEVKEITTPSEQESK